MAYPSPYPPAGPFQPVGQQQRRGVLLPVLGAVAMGICGLIVLGLVGSQIGVMAVLVGAVAALVPVAVVVGAFLWLDRWEPEPPRVLLAAFGWGACVATLSALIINSTAKMAAEEILGQGSGDVVSAVLSAPLVEEGMKVAFLFGLLWIRRREFDGVIDGMVYAGMTAAGFAFTENILYFGRAFAESGMVAGAGGGVLMVFVLRGLLSPFAHPLFTAMTGIAVGIALNSRNGAVRLLLPIAGFLASVSLHALWNGSATIGGGLGFVLVYIVIMVPLFVATVVLVVWQRRREQRVLAAELPGIAQRGWIAHSEVGMLANLTMRRNWRNSVRRRSGPAASKAVAGYQATVTELAFLRARMAKGTAGTAAGQWHHELVTALVAARGATGPGAPYPPGSPYPPRPGPPGHPAQYPTHPAQYPTHPAQHPGHQTQYPGPPPPGNQGQRPPGRLGPPPGVPHPGSAVPPPGGQGGPSAS